MRWPVLIGLCWVLACEPCSRLPRGGHVRPPPATPDEHDVCTELPDEPGCRGTTPRCAANDPRCGPIPGWNYEGCYRPQATREPLLQGSIGHGADCDHDGECWIGGCGNWCVSYRRGGARLTSTCLAEEGFESDDLLCGCVDRRCSWFRQ